MDCGVGAMMDANDVRSMFAAMDYSVETHTMNTPEREFGKPYSYEQDDAEHAALWQPEQWTDAELLDEERHARHMDGEQYRARIAELEREVAERDARLAAVPVQAIMFVYDNLPTPQDDALACALDDIGAWVIDLDTQERNSHERQRN